MLPACNIEPVQYGAHFDRGRPLRREGQDPGEVLPGFFRIPPLAQPAGVPAPDGPLRPLG